MLPVRINLLWNDPALHRRVSARESTKQWRMRNLQHVKEYQYVYARKPESLERRRQQDQERYSAERGRRSRLKYHLRVHFNLSIEAYETLLSEQPNCAICDLLFDSSQRSTQPQLDHCHATGKIRALLCGRCNTRMAVIDDVDHLTKLLAYRDAHK